MTDTKLYPSYSVAPLTRNGERAKALGSILMRCALGVIFLWFGAMKFTSYEATSISPFVMNSLLVGWWHGVFGIQGTSHILGVFEVVAGALLLAGFVKPLLSVIGGAMGVITFLITLSFLFSTPGVAEPLAGGFPALSAAPGQFLLKDVGLLGISLFIVGESLLRMRSGAVSGVASIDASIDRRSETGAQILRWGVIVIRYGLALIFLWFGGMKFTSYEATGIAPFIMNSPLVNWWHSLLGIQGTSYMLGIIEITTGILLTLYQITPRASVVGGAMAVVTFLITLTFFLTTPGVAAPMGFPAISVHIGQFLLKDAGLLGISIWLLGESLLASAVRAPTALAHR
ncbi:MAG: YkgB family protein [Pseudomonas sp.]